MGLGQSRMADYMRYSVRPTMYEAEKNWCRCCGSKSNLTVGPWGSQSICSLNCSKTLNLESLPDLIRPLCQQFCHSCKSNSSSSSNPIIQCDGCPKAIHLNCFNGKIPKDILSKSSKRKWYCSTECRPLKIITKKRRRIQKVSRIKSIPITPPPDDFNIPKFIKREISTPNWKMVTHKSARGSKRVREDTSDEIYICRHAKCEALEKEDRPPV